ncbi:hypothetical protein [Sediminibacillus albus]|uniref:Uncharacterized protein n=1 Tax=Sediminibacillus albus TaxID=407036 RepID=A0A1G8WH60_9BACI|nr:hypothetical protein [Sediminibacillus albus]SDJ77005.1 hypothetical protein SAMN05216243_0768 [Sediminibacillus albus]
MTYIIESMNLPVDNFLGMFLYLLLFMAGAGLLIGLPLHFIPNRLPYEVKSALVGMAVFLSMYLWWIFIF